MSVRNGWRSTSTLRLYLVQSRNTLRELAGRPGELLVSTLLSLVFSLLGPLFQVLIYEHTSGYPGWNRQQILLFQGVLLIGDGLSGTLFGDVRKRIEQLAEHSELDRVLLKPLSPLAYILSGGFSPRTPGSLLVGAGLVLWSSACLGTATVARAIAALAFVASAVLLRLTANVVYCTLAARWTYTFRLSEVIDKVLRFGDFPLEIYPMVLRTAFVTLLPLSVASYWPAQALLGRTRATAWIAMASAIVLWFGAVRLWSHQLDLHQSAGA